MDRASSTRDSTRLGRKTVASVLVLLLAGVQWDILQGIAWAGMLVKYTARYDLSTAAKMTFDGAHPCALCTVVASVRSAPPADTDQLAAAPSTPMVDLDRAAGPDDHPVTRSITRRPARSEFEPASAGSRPPVPPPRFAS